MNTLFACFIILCAGLGSLPQTVQAQGVPGGVNSNLQVWLKANDTTLASGGPFNTPWPDASGNNNHALYTGTGNYQALPNEINFNPTLQLNNEHFEVPVGLNQPFVYVFTVYRLDQDADLPIWGNAGGSTLTADKQMLTKTHSIGPSTVATHYGGDVDGKVFLNYAFYNANAAQVEVQLSGQTVSVGALPTVGAPTTSFYLGGSNNGNLYSVGGNNLASNDELQVAECVVYTGASTLTANGLARINSYLALKYGLTLSQDYLLSNGTHAWHHGSGYDHRVLGLARDDGSDLLQSEARSVEDSSYLTLSLTRASDLTNTNLQTLLVGDDNHATGQVAATSIHYHPTFLGYAQRMQRTWRVQKQGNFVTGLTSAGFTLAFDTTMLVPTGFRRNGMVLVVSSDSNFTNIRGTYALNSRGGQEVASGVILNDGDYFTLAQPEATLWAHADSSLSTGGRIDQLTNQLYAGNHLNGIGLTSAAERPDYVNALGLDSVMNYHPYVRFNQNGEENYLHIPQYHGWGGTEGSIFMVVGRAPQTGANSDVLLSYSDLVGSFLGNEWVIENPTDLGIRLQSIHSIVNYGFDITNDRPAIVSSMLDLSNDTMGMGYNGDLNVQYNPGSSNSIATQGSLVIGQEQDANNRRFYNQQMWNGAFAEIIALNRRASLQDKSYIESYLALKYGVTLMGNYELPDVTQQPLLVWDANHSSGNYHHRITGVGHYAPFNWYQTRSRNRSEPEVYLKITNATFGNTESVLIVGDDDGDYHTLDPNNAPSTAVTSNRVWYVRNRNNGVSTVDLTFVRPNGMSLQPISVNLMVNGSDYFRGGAQTMYQGVVYDSIIVFNNVNLGDGDYFCISEEREPVFLNHDALWPGSLEACPGSRVTFYYQSLGSPPVAISFNRKGGGTISTPVQHVSDTTGLPNVAGQVSFNIPLGAITGPVRLLDVTNNILYTYPDFLTIHDPNITMYAQTNPICATDSVQLLAVPTGGTFIGEPAPNWAAAADPLIVDSSGLIRGLGAGWSTINDSARYLVVRYEYLPEYSDGGKCSQIISDLDTFAILDNRLLRVDYRPIRPINGSNQYPLLLDSSVVSQTVPDLLDPSFQRYGFPVDFYGTYVNQPMVGSYNFLGTQALNGQSRTLASIIIRYNNGGCQAELESDVVVYEPATIIGLPDTMCISSTPVTFSRDVSPNNRYSRDTVSYINGSTLITNYNTYNRVTEVLTSDPTLQGAIQIIDTVTLNGERFRVNPQFLPPSTTELIIEMRYRQFTTTVESDLSRPNNPPLVSHTTYYFTISDTITILPRPNMSLTGLEPVYCAEAGPDTLQVMPLYEYAPRTRFSITATDSFGIFNQQDTLPSLYVVDPAALYQRYRPAGNLDLDFYVSYTVERYGCVDVVRDTAHIDAPLKPYFTHNSPYCANSDNNLLSPGWFPGTTGPRAAGRFTPMAGLDSVGNLVTALMGPGHHQIEYSYVDVRGCRTSFTDSIFVQTPPDIRVYIDSSRTVSQFCASDDPVLLNYVLLAGNNISTIQYTGVGVFADTFKPRAIAAPGSGAGIGSGGTVYVGITAIDSFGCRGADSLPVRVEREPNIDLDIAFNNRPTVLSNGLVVNHSYCHNHPDWTLRPLPYHIDTNNVTRGGYTGLGIYIRGDSVYYDPNLVAEGSVDTVTYTYTSAEGCVNSATTYIKIDTIPVVSLSGLRESYCANADTLHLTGFPDASLGRPGGSTGFGGRGLNINTGVLDFANAGVGAVIYFYQFEDSKLCRGIDRDTVYIHPGPNAAFSGYNARKQYCREDPPEQWISHNDTTAPSYFYFWSDTSLAIIDSSGLFSPNLGNNALPNSNVTGSYDIYYMYVDTNGCADSKSVNIFIHPTPEIVLTGLDSAYCFNAFTDQISMSESAQVEINTPGNFTTLGNILFFTPNFSTAGIKSYTLTYTDSNTLCSDTIRGNTRVFPPSSPAIALDTNYCDADDAFLLDTLGTPRGGRFSGLGVDSTATGYVFNPFRAGEGTHRVRYTVRDTFVYGLTAPNSLVCGTQVEQDVFVRPTPKAILLSPTARSFCSSDTSQRLVPADALNRNLTHLFTGPYISVRQDSIGDTTINVGNGPQVIPIYGNVYLFNPSLVTTGTSDIVYTVTNAFGCSDSLVYTYAIAADFAYPLFSLDSVFCTSDDSVRLTGSRGFGTFLLNGDSLGTPPYYVPSTTPIAGTYALDTVVYNVVRGACSATDTTVVTLYQSPSATFRHLGSSDTFCLGDDPVSLIPSVLGGEFTGDGVRRGSSVFEPQIVNAGIQQVRYSISDATTGCSTTHERAFYVYGQPSISYQTVGGCQNDTIHFVPDSVILGIDNFYNNALFDSITSVQWVLSPTLTVAGVLDSNRVLPFSHPYSDSGVYFTQLIVANQVHCVDTHQVRIVISPTVSTFPYIQGFESSSGGWYPERRSLTHNLLWEWGIDSSRRGIQGSANNHIWTTGIDQSYGPSEAAWVYGPCLDISSLDRPMISLDYWSDSRGSSDGAVVEYQRPDGTWGVLGELNRGINWYNTGLIAGSPGDQVLSPMGWSGNHSAWRNGRYRLDDYRGPNDLLRLRIAFASASIPLSNFYDGFAFDNICVQNRTRNAMVETTSHNVPQNMERDNRHIYNLLFHTHLNKDVMMIQYHVSSPDRNDEFYQQSSTVSNSRGVVIGNATGGYALIDGDSAILSYDLKAVNFEQSMLEDPKFDVRIDTFSHISNVFTIIATVTAKEDMPFSDYRIHTVITEDSLYYTNLGDYSDELHAVVRMDNHGGAPYTERKAWVAGETKRVVFTWDHSNAPFIQYDPGDFQAVVFIQDPGARQVFQAQTTRDVSGYWMIGIDPIEAIDEYNEIANVTLFPNPAATEFHLRFDAPLSTDYQWKLVDIRGVEVKRGEVTKGTSLLTIQNQDYPAGTYLLLLYNNRVFTQRKVVLHR